MTRSCSTERIAVARSERAHSARTGKAWREIRPLCLRDAHRRAVREGARRGVGSGRASHRQSLLFASELQHNGLAEFESDALRAEPLISGYRNFARLFRYPMFKEGDTATKRDGMRAFLRARGYRMGRATIDASDWAINTRLEKCLRTNPAADVGPYRAFFLQHIWERAQYYQHLAQEVVQQPVRHTVLLHHSTLNALFVSDLIAMFAARGWRPIDAPYAYQDPIYERQPKCLPAGESLLWGLAKETGHFESELRYPGEDDVYENPKMDALGL